MSILRPMLLGALTAAAPFLAGGDTTAKHPGQARAIHHHDSPARLVAVVRDATQQYLDVNAAMAANYQPLFGCVSGPDHGAMGVHLR